MISTEIAARGSTFLYCYKLLSVGLLFITIFSIFSSLRRGSKEKFMERAVGGVNLMCTVYLTSTIISFVGFWHLFPAGAWIHALLQYGIRVPLYIAVSHHWVVKGRCLTAAVSIVACKAAHWVVALMVYAQADTDPNTSSAFMVKGEINFGTWRVFSFNPQHMWGVFERHLTISDIKNYSTPNIVYLLVLLVAVDVIARYKGIQMEESAWERFKYSF